MEKKHKKPISIPALVSFALVASALLIEGNIVVYCATISLFGVQDFRNKCIVGLMFFLLSGGFIAMLFIEKYSASIVTRILYLVTAVWTGTFAYLFIAAVVYDITNVFVYNARPIGLSLFFVALMTGLYGVVHAQHIVVRKIQVPISGLPEVWKHRSMVWMSDLHLGSVRGPRFAQKATNLSNSLSPDIVVIGGDLYDGTHAPDPFVIAQPLQKLVSRSGTFYIAGNHEEFEDPHSFLEAVHKLGIRILNDEKIDIDGMQIIGLDYSNSSKKENFKNNLEKINLDSTKPSILLKHEPKDLDIAEQAGISFQISGHTHNGQQWPFNYLANMAYKGYGYGFKKYGSMQVYVSSGIGGWGPPVRVGSDCEIVYITFI